MYFILGLSLIHLSSCSENEGRYFCGMIDPKNPPSNPKSVTGPFGTGLIVGQENGKRIFQVGRTPEERPLKRIETENSLISVYEISVFKKGVRDEYEKWEVWRFSLLDGILMKTNVHHYSFKFFKTDLAKMYSNWKEQFEPTEKGLRHLIHKYNNDPEVWQWIPKNKKPDWYSHAARHTTFQCNKVSLPMYIILYAFSMLESAG